MKLEMSFEQLSTLLGTTVTDVGLPMGAGREASDGNRSRLILGVEGDPVDHEAEKRALREQLAEAKRNAHESEADYREMRRALDDLRLQLTAVTRERDEARTILTTGLDLLAFIGDEPINNVERKIAAWTRQAREALPFTAARDCQNTTAGCHTPMACESAGRCEWPVPGTP